VIEIDKVEAVVYRPMSTLSMSDAVRRRLHPHRTQPDFDFFYVGHGQNFLTGALPPELEDELLLLPDDDGVLTLPDERELLLDELLLNEFRR